MERLIEFSRRYGADTSLVIAGGGNTSMKENGVLYVKASGTALAEVQKDNFVALDLKKLMQIPEKEYPKTDKEREAAFLADIMAARLPGEESKRPSVETLLHAMFPQRYVLHLHPAMVNGLTCSVEGEQAAKRLFPDAAWVNECRPGYTLAMLLYSKVKGGADTVLLQNHGVFFAADDPRKLDEMLSSMLSTLEKAIEEGYDPSKDDGAELTRPFTPDHIVYCGVGPALPHTANAALLWKDAEKIAHYAASFGGARPMAEEMVKFILNWEAESYRRKQA